MKRLRKWLIDKLWTTETTGYAVRMWLRRSSFEQVAEMIRTERTLWHLSHNPPKGRRKEKGESQ